MKCLYCKNKLLFSSNYYTLYSTKCESCNVVYLKNDIFSSINLYILSKDYLLPIKINNPSLFDKSNRNMVMSAKLYLNEEFYCPEFMLCKTMINHKIKNILYRINYDNFRLEYDAVNCNDNISSINPTNFDKKLKTMLTFM